MFPRIITYGLPRSQVIIPCQRTVSKACASTSAASPNENAVAKGLAAVRVAIGAAAAARARTSGRPVEQVRLVAVSKIKPVETLMAAYNEGQRYFGENYVKELLEKAPHMPPDVKWHFIGHLQRNKVKQLIKNCPNLQCIESVDSQKLAKELNKALVATNDPERKLRVLVQVNSSAEETKNGIDPGPACTELCTFIAKECDRLVLGGLMTIGAPDFSGCRVEDFETLHRCRADAASALGIDPFSLELSMGMSNDYENAIIEGSTTVRVGSSIFGARPKKA